MPYSVSACFDKFRKEVVDLDPAQVSLARSSRDFVLSNITRLSSEGALPNVLAEYCLNFGSFARRTKVRPLDDIDMMICYDGSSGYTTQLRRMNSIIFALQIIIHSSMTFAMMTGER